MAQPPDSQEEYERLYKERITKKYLDGVYIPQNLEDAIKELNRLSNPEGLERFKTAPEDVVIKKAHFGLGRWISHNWGFQLGSRYSHYLRTAGVSDPDDMIRFTLKMWHRSLNDKPLLFKEEAIRIKELAKEKQEERFKQREVIDTIKG